MKKEIEKVEVKIKIKKASLMTKEEYQRIIKIYGKDFGWFDIPTYIRQREKADKDLPGWDEWQEEKEKEEYEERN